jgi:hypothetical protein
MNPDVRCDLTRFGHVNRRRVSPLLACPAFHHRPDFPDLQQLRLGVEHVRSGLPCATAAAHVRVVLKRSRGSIVDDRQHGSVAMMIDPSAKLLAVLDHAEEYRGLATRAKDRGEREIYERIVELYVEIAEELEALIDGRS